MLPKGGLQCFPEGKNLSATAAPLYYNTYSQVDSVIFRGNMAYWSDGTGISAFPAPKQSSP